MLLDYGMKRGKRARVPVEIGICSVPLRFRSITSKFSHFFRKIAERKMRVSRVPIDEKF